ncbi:MAG: hypothetical protein HUJ72_11245 [Blautia sp.]|nr:hypothetical protein [Blautia sp.]
MMKKGSITVFLSLVMSVLLLLISICIESVRMQAARTQILNSVDIGLYSLFGQFEKTLLEEYDLFGIDSSGSGSKANISAVYSNFEGYMKPVLKQQNTQKLKLQQGGITGYQLLTDHGGEVFYQQVVQYMKDTLGSHGVDLLLDRIRDRETRTLEAELLGEESEKKDSLNSYDAEIQAAEQKSREVLEAQQAGNVDENGQSYPVVVLPEQPLEPVENPIPAIKKARRRSILDLVLSSARDISDRSVDKHSLVSGRSLQQGMGTLQSIEYDNGYASQILFQQYMDEKLGNFRKPAKTAGLKYEMEYVLYGKEKDRDNLKAVAARLLIIREGVNYAGLMADSAKSAEIKAMAAAIAMGFLFPPASVVIESALLLCWSFAESIIDVRDLFDGKKVPLVKRGDQWQISLSNLIHVFDLMDSLGKNDEEGMSYEDYLQVLLLAKSKNTKVMRTMDMIEAGMRTKTGDDSFCMDSCLTALEVSVDVKANKRKTFQTIRQYCYD